MSAVQIVSDENRNIIDSICAAKQSSQVLILVVSSNDCFKCSFNFSTLLKEERLKGIRKVIISDEFVTARNLVEGLVSSPEFIINPLLLQKLSPTGSSLLIAKNGTNIQLYNMQVVDQPFLQEISVSFTSACGNSFSFSDSLVSSGHLYRAIFNDGYLLFDPKSQYWIGLKDNVVQYAKTVPLDSQYVYSLPSRVDKTRFSIINSYAKMLAQAWEARVPVFRVEGITFRDSLLCVSFVLNRFFNDRENVNNIGIFTTYFIATKKVRNYQDLFNVASFNTYDHIFFADNIEYANEKLPIRIFSPISIISPDEIFVKVNVADDATQTTKFYGGALLRLDNKASQLKPIAVDRTVGIADSLDSKSSYGNCMINIYKEVQDMSSNLGTIFVKPELKKEEPTY